MAQAAPEIGEETGRDSTLVSRNVCICGRRTSVRLEPDMWSALLEIAEREGCRVHDVCTLVHLCKRGGTSLTAAIRVFIMLYFKAAVTEEGHARAGHGDFDNMIRRARMTREIVVQKNGRVGSLI